MLTANVIIVIIIVMKIRCFTIVRQTSQRESAVKNKKAMLEHHPGHFHPGNL
jgi:hypothetical protein